MDCFGELFLRSTRVKQHKGSAKIRKLTKTINYTLELRELMNAPSGNDPKKQSAPMTTDRENSRRISN